MIIDKLIYNTALYSDKPAFIFLQDEKGLEKSISYSQLTKHVASLALYLETNVVKGSRALLVYKDSRQFIIAFLACQYAGLVAVPFYYGRATKDFLRLIDMIDLAEIGVVLTTEDIHNTLENSLEGVSRCTVKLLITTSQHVHRDMPASRPVVESPTAFIQYTSGSTGSPKGVIVSRENLLHNQEMLKETFSTNSNSIILSWLPFYHDMGLIGNILHSLYIGCTCILMPPSDFLQKPQRWLAAISKFKVTHTGGPNFAYDLCVKRISLSEVSTLDLSSWKVAYNGSEPVKYETVTSFFQHFKQLGFNYDAFSPCYGLAESTLLVTGVRPKERVQPLYLNTELLKDGIISLTNPDHIYAKPLVSCGVLGPDVDIKIVRHNSSEVLNDLEEGEICLRGQSVTSGYSNDSSSDHFLDLGGKRFLRTGDLGFIYNNELYVHGRLKEMLVIRGKNYYPYDIEQMIAEHFPFIEANGVVACRLDRVTEELLLIAEIKREFINSTDLKSLIESIDKKVFGMYGISVHDIVLMPSFGIPRTSSGKLKRSQCIELYKKSALKTIGSKLLLYNKASTKIKDESLLDEVLKNAGPVNIKLYLINLIESKTGFTYPQTAGDTLELSEAGIDSLKVLELINTLNKDLSINLNPGHLLKENSLTSLIVVVENMLWLKSKVGTGPEITL